MGDYITIIIISYVIISDAIVVNIIWHAIIVVLIPIALKQLFVLRMWDDAIRSVVFIVQYD